MIKRLCSFPGCSFFREEGASYCKKHWHLEEEKREKAEQRKQEYFQSFRPTRYSNLLGSPRWKKLRAEHLRQHPVCEICGSSDNLQVHHNYPKGYDYSAEEDFFNPDCLQTLCTSCHARVTDKRTGIRQ